MRHLRTVTAVALVGVLTLAGATALGSSTSPGTTPAAAASRRTSAVRGPVAASRTIDVVGDSIALQSEWHRSDRWRRAGRGVPEHDRIQRDFWLGYHFEDVQARETMRVNGPEDRRPSVLVIALGINNSLVASGGGWDGSDQEAFRTLLHTPSPQACVVVVLPQAGPSAAEVDRLNIWVGRQAMRELAGQRPRTVIVDWADVVDAHPEYLDADGIHLATGRAEPGQLADPDATDAYAAMLWRGVAQCPAESPVARTGG